MNGYSFKKRINFQPSKDQQNTEYNFQVAALSINIDESFATDFNRNASFRF